VAQGYAFDVKHKTLLSTALLVAACGSRASAPSASPVAALAPAPAASASTQDAASVPAAPPPAVEATSEPPPPPAPRRPGATANVDPNDDEVPGPPDVLPDCEDQLKRAGIAFRPASLPVHQEGKRRKLVCGAPQVVIYQRGPGNITYEPAPLVTCPMALALASFERIVQEQASALFSSAVVRVQQLGTYNCREMAAFPGWVSEHAYANAIDLARFTLKSGLVIEVVRDFDRGAGPPSRKAGAFLRTVSQRAFDEDVFSHVLTPFFDEHHRDHFHVDLARYRGDGTRPDA